MLTLVTTTNSNDGHDSILISHTIFSFLSSVQLWKEKKQPISADFQKEMMRRFASVLSKLANICK